MEIYLIYILAAVALTGTLIMSARKEQDYAFWKTVVTGILVFGISLGIAEITEQVFFNSSSMALKHVVTYVGWLVMIGATAGITHFFFRVGIKNASVVGITYFLVLMFLNWLLRQI
tara:strand:- start:655 stop:1002 length:348 start_codon:yes stop_codon:yes gene_type:complete